MEARLQGREQPGSSLPARLALPREVRSGICASRDDLKSEGGVAKAVAAVHVSRQPGVTAGLCPAPGSLLASPPPGSHAASQATFLERQLGRQGLGPATPQCPEYLIPWGLSLIYGIDQEISKVGVPSSTMMVLIIPLSDAD